MQMKDRIVDEVKIKTRKRNHSRSFTAAAAVVLMLLSTFCTAYAGEAGEGTVTYRNQQDLGNGVTYTNTISQNPTYGIQQSFSFTTIPLQIVKPIVLACDTIYGSLNIDNVVTYAQQLGYNVLAAMNTDFFSMQTGIPLGLVIENGVYKCSPEGFPAVVFDADGRASVLSSPGITIQLTNQGTSVPTASISTANESGNAASQANEGIGSQNGPISTLKGAADMSDNASGTSNDVSGRASGTADVPDNISGTLNGGFNREDSTAKETANSSDNISASSDGMADEANGMTDMSNGRIGTSDAAAGEAIDKTDASDASDNTTDASDETVSSPSSTISADLSSTQTAAETTALSTIADEQTMAAAGENTGKYVTLTHFNKLRQSGGGLYLLDQYFSTVSTRTSTPGWAVKMKIVEGTMKTKGTMRLVVTELYEGSEALPIGDGYMVLTADNRSNLHYEFEKFSVGDEVLLETSCWSDPILENAQWGTGSGNIIVQNGAITDTSGWDSALVGKNPRSALGIRADGSVVYYELDGRQPGYSNGITMRMLAQEMIDRGCVTAVNFDGGGSSAMAAKLPGSSSVQVVSSPSDGALRKCATYVLLVSSAVTNGIPNVLTLDQAGSVVYQGASMGMSFGALDTGNGAAAAPADTVAEATAGYGTISGTSYTAGWTAGMETLSLSSASTGLTGTSSVYVTNKLDSVSVTANGSAVSALSLSGGDQVQFEESATYNGKPVIIGPANFSYTLSDSRLGTISESGLLTINKGTSGSATLTIAAGGITKTVEITVNSVFSDISGNWAESYITEMYEKEIVNGIGDGKFGPQQNIRRADFMVMLHRAVGSPESGSAAGFHDVAADAYYANAVKWAQSLGIAEGDGYSFLPEANLTREQAFAFLYRYLMKQGASLTAGDNNTLAAFSDADKISEYALEPTSVLTASGIVNGINGQMSPAKLLSRAEMCKLLSESFKLV